MAFELVNSGANDVAFERIQKTTAAVTAPGDLLEHAAGVAGSTRADSGTTTLELHAVAQETTAAADTSVLVLPLRPGMKFIADLANNSDAAHNGDLMTLTDHDTLNNSGTNVTNTTGVFRQVAPFGAAADKKAVVEVVAALEVVTA